MKKNIDMEQAKNEFAEYLLTPFRTPNSDVPAVVKEGMKQALEQLIDDHMQKIDQLVYFVSACDAIDKAKQKSVESFGSKYADQDTFAIKAELCGRRHQLFSMLDEIRNHSTAAASLFKAKYTNAVRQFDIDSDFKNRAVTYLSKLDERIKQLTDKEQA